MKKLRWFVSVTGILGIIAVFALILLYLALSDIADAGIHAALEWYVAGICLIVLALFILSAMITIVLVSGYLNKGFRQIETV